MAVLLYLLFGTPLHWALPQSPPSYSMKPEVPVRSEAPARSAGPRPGIGLALGGGFARGFAHLGVLQVLEQNHIRVSHVAGTSVGSILGRLMQRRPLAKILATCRTLKFRDIARWRVSRLGLASNHRLSDLMDAFSKPINSKTFVFPWQLSHGPCHV